MDIAAILTFPVPLAIDVQAWHYNSIVRGLAL